MYHVKRIVLSTALFFILIYILIGISVKSSVDAEAQGFIPEISIEVYKASFKEFNESTGKYLEFAEFIINNISANEMEFRGYLYFAQPATDWVLTSQYINVILFFDGFDSRYFAGFSTPRIQFILASPDYTELNIESPADDEALVIIDSRYRFSSDPIFKIIRESDSIAIYYPAVLSIELNYTLRYIDTETLASHLGIPESVEYEAGRYDFRSSPPIYILVNRKSYLDILTLFEPVVYGKLYTINLIPDFIGDTYLNKYSTVTNVISKLEEYAGERGLEDTRIRSTNFIAFNDYILSYSSRVSIPYLALALVASIAIPIGNKYIKSRASRRSRDKSIYIIPIYIIIILSIHYLMGLYIYIPLAVTTILLILPSLLLIYLTFKGRI